MLKTIVFAILVISLMVLCIPIAPVAATAADIQESTLTVGLFEKVYLYRESPRPSHVVLFVSGDGGWKLGVVDMARQLAGLDALVVGIDIVGYLKRLGQSPQTCLYPAADFEMLSKVVQKNMNYPEYVQPILAGYSSGATLVYALVCQAPSNTFKAALSLGFCPDLPLARSPCKGSGLTWQKDPAKEIYLFTPNSRLETPWAVFQGETDQVCDPQATREFVSKVAGAQLVMLPKVGHGFSVPSNWMPRFKQVFSGLAGGSHPGPLSGPVDLPLVEVPAKEQGRSDLAVMVTGDGGWAGIDKQLAEELSGRGMAVVGLNSLKYFWTARTPESAARDLERILVYYMEQWHKERAILIGYSLGADVLPFMAARLPAELRDRIEVIALLGPGRETAFEFHLSEWMGRAAGADQYSVLPEVVKLSGLTTLCIYGEEEKDSLCLDQLPPAVIKVPLGGGHHFGGAYPTIARKIIETIQQK